jgi:pimeloyl-ACP methyl ester carboxylesterase
MNPVLLPVAERVGRFVLRRTGVESRFVDTPIGSLHCYDGPGSGSLPTAVLLHGIGSAATPFGAFLTHLRRHVRRVVAPDYPGHGFSAGAAARLTPEVLFGSVGAALDAIIDEPSIVIGNSLGGAVALHYALARPERVRALVLLSPAGARASDEEWRELRSTFALASRADASAFLRRLYHRPPWFLPLLAHEFPAALGRPAVRDLLESATNDDAPTPEALGALRMPILFLWGRSERLLPEAHFEYFRRHLPKHARVERPSGFGHCPHFDDPAALAARVVAFAREAVGAA